MIKNLLDFFILADFLLKLQKVFEFMSTVLFKIICSRKNTR